MNDNIRCNFEPIARANGAPIKRDLAITTACDAYEAAFGQQDSAVGSRIAKNAESGAEMAQLIALKSTATHMVPNFCSVAAKLVFGAPLLPEEGWTRSGRGGGSYDGMPITADNIFASVKGKMEKEI